jgi:hypothetical protein
MLPGSTTSRARDGRAARRTTLLFLAMTVGLLTAPAGVPDPLLAQVLAATTFAPETPDVPRSGPVGTTICLLPSWQPASLRIARRGSQASSHCCRSRRSST